MLTQTNKRNREQHSGLSWRLIVTKGKRAAFGVGPCQVYSHQFVSQDQCVNQVTRTHDKMHLNAMVTSLHDDTHITVSNDVYRGSEFIVLSVLTQKKINDWINQSCSGATNMLYRSNEHCSLPKLIRNNYITLRYIVYTRTANNVWFMRTSSNKRIQE